jgi:hypothetical protein
MNSEILFSQALGLPSPWKVEEICFLSAPMSAQSELHIYLGFEGSVASIIKNEAGLILGHNYPAKAINCL